jgi:hypothetical protein
MSNRLAELKSCLLRGAAPLRTEPWSRKLAELQQPVWLVGGAVRDLALGLPVKDLDLVLPRGRSLPVGRELAAALSAGFVLLHEAFGVCRIVLTDGRHLDLSDLQAGSIEDDFAAATDDQRARPPLARREQLLDVTGAWRTWTPVGPALRPRRAA